jgi:hypothetical protein
MSEDKGRWGMSPKHITLLCNALPESRDILELRFDDEEDAGPSPAKRVKVAKNGKSSTGVNGMWLKLAEMVLSARVQSCGLIWKLQLKHLEFRNLETADLDNKQTLVFHSPDYKTTEGRIFTMRIDICKGYFHRIVVRQKVLYWLRSLYNRWRFLGYSSLCMFVLEAILNFALYQEGNPG